MSGRTIAIIGGGPAGLMAAELASAAGHSVTVYDGMPTVGRKLLLAGKSGLNITHAEEHAHLVTRYGPSQDRLQAALDAFTGADIRAWAGALGVDTFVGSSGRVFPSAMKASPLLRAWLGRLAAAGVSILTRHRWSGWRDGELVFETPRGPVIAAVDATLLALGGASYPRLGSDAAWVSPLKERGVDVRPFRPANCGFDVNWPPAFVERHAGQPVKSVTASSARGTIPGEFVISRHGVEGSLVYAHSAALRDAIERHGQAGLLLDLVPGRTIERLARDLARQPNKASFSNKLRKGAGLDATKAALAGLFIPAESRNDADALARLLKALVVPLLRPRPIEEAISSAGGIAWSEIDNSFMLRKIPGLFVAGEMIDWEAPTGGYLLTGCLATGRAAGRGMLTWLNSR